MFQNKTTITTPDTSGSYSTGEVFTNTSTDGSLFAQIFGGNSSISKNAVLTSVDIYYTASTNETGVAVDNTLVLITDSVLGTNYQIYMQYDPSLIGSPWKFEINGKEYGSIDDANPSHVFTSGSTTVTIAV